MSDRTFTVIESAPGEADVIIHGTWHEENQQFAVDFAANLAQEYNNQQRQQIEDNLAQNEEIENPDDYIDPGEPVLIEPTTPPPDIQPSPVWYAATGDHNHKVYVKETSADTHPVDTEVAPGDAVHEPTGTDATGTPTGTGYPDTGLPVDQPVAGEPAPVTGDVAAVDPDTGAATPVVDEPVGGDSSLIDKIAAQTPDDTGVHTTMDAPQGDAPVTDTAKDVPTE